MKYVFLAYGSVQPKQRPKFNRRTGTAYTPNSTVEFEASVRCYAQKYLADNDYLPMEGACDVHITIHKAVPERASKKKRKEMLQGLISVTTKPDVDNVAKSILDALNGVWYKDDRQVVKLTVEKLYSERDYYRVECKSHEV